MLIAIHRHKDSFSDRWIPYCESNNIDYKLVDCYRTDIIDQLADCDALMSVSYTHLDVYKRQEV